MPGSAHSTNPSGTVGEIMGGTHTADMSENELLGMPNRMDALPSRPATGNLRADIDCLSTPTSNEWNGGTIEPARRAAMGHAVTVADYAEKSTDIEVGGDSRLFSTPNCMDMIAPRSGRALEYVLRRGDPKRGMAGSTGNLREDVMMRDVTVLPTPTSRDGKGRNQRNTDDCMPVAADNMSITVPGPYHGGLWGLDDGRGVRFGRFTAAIRRWERVSGRPAPCPTQATGGLRRWAAANQADPTLFDPWWLACHTPFDAHPKARLDQPMRDRMLARWRAADRGMSLIDPMFWPGCKDMDPDIPIPATRLPDKSVLDYGLSLFGVGEWVGGGGAGRVVWGVWIPRRCSPPPCNCLTRGGCRAWSSVTRRTADGNCISRSGSRRVRGSPARNRGAARPRVRCMTRGSACGGI